MEFELLWKKHRYTFRGNGLFLDSYDHHSQKYPHPPKKRKQTDHYHSSLTIFPVSNLFFSKLAFIRTVSTAGAQCCTRKVCFYARTPISPAAWLARSGDCQNCLSLIIVSRLWLVDDCWTINNESDQSFESRWYRSLSAFVLKSSIEGQP